MSELDDLRVQNKELKKLLGNALDLLEKSRLALSRQAQSSSAVRAKSKTIAKKPKKVISKKRRGNP